MRGSWRSLFPTVIKWPAHRNMRRGRVTGFCSGQTCCARLQPNSNLADVSPQIENGQIGRWNADTEWSMDVCLKGSRIIIPSILRRPTRGIHRHSKAVNSLRMRSSGWPPHTGGVYQPQPCLRYLQHSNCGAIHGPCVPKLSNPQALEAKRIRGALRAFI